MPVFENGRRNKSLEQYSDSFLGLKSSRLAAEKLLEEVARYRHVGSTVPLENKTHNYTEYNFNTDQEGTWKLRLVGIPQRKFAYVNGNYREMERLEENLAERQLLDIPSEDLALERKHSRGIHFAAGNVDLIDEMLTGNQRAKTRRQPLWFVESKVPTETGHRRTDLIIVGSDNRVRILEFGNGIAKPEVVMDQARGVQRLYKEINGVDMPPSRVLSHVVQYSTQPDVNELTIHEPTDLQTRFEKMDRLEGIKQKTASYTIHFT